MRKFRGYRYLAGALALQACSPSPSDTANVAQSVDVGPPVTETPGVVAGPIVHAGAGLKGLTSLRPEALLDRQAMAGLMSVIYPDQGANIIIEKGDETYNAEPLAAIRHGDQIIFLVNNRNTTDCHACSGATSIYYMSGDGSRVVKAYPFVLTGTGWGESSKIEAIMLPGEGVGVLSSAGYMAQGYACSGYQLVRLSPGEPRPLTRFPDGYDDTGNYGPTSIGITGMEFSGSNQLRLHWAGSSKSEDGVHTPLAEDRVATLDGTEPQWAKEWKYTC